MLGDACAYARMFLIFRLKPSVVRTDQRLTPAPAGSIRLRVKIET